MPVFCRVASIARLLLIDSFSRIHYTLSCWILRRFECVYLILAQDAKGEGLALQDDVVCVTVAPDGDRQAWGTFGGLHHPRCRHGVGLTTTPGSHHVDPVGQVT